MYLIECNLEVTSDYDKLSDFCEEYDKFINFWDDDNDPRHSNIEHSRPEPTFSMITQRDCRYIFKHHDKIMGFVNTNKESNSNCLMLHLYIGSELRDDLVSLGDLLANIFNLEQSRHNQPNLSVIYMMGMASSLVYRPLMQYLGFQLGTWSVPHCAGGLYYFKDLELCSTHPELDSQTLEMERELDMTYQTLLIERQELDRVRQEFLQHVDSP